MRNERLRVAVLDMYNKVPNEGMRCIREILTGYNKIIDVNIFDVRAKAELPGLDHDIYISTGGPGSPHEGDGIWDHKWHAWLENIRQYNLQNQYPKKHVFLICHSFQMAAIHFKVGEVGKRKSQSFGTFPVHKTEAGLVEPFFKHLPTPFYAVDFREYQLTKPNKENIDKLGVKILALEKIRPHVDLERAIMALRFSDEIMGVQFHPEADGQGMLEHFKQLDKKKFVIEHYGEDKYYRMLRDLNDPNKIELTHDIIIPTFLNTAISQLRRVQVAY